MKRSNVTSLLLLVSITLAEQNTLSSRASVIDTSEVQSAYADKTPQVFEVATIKRNPSPNGWKLQFTLNGFTARGVTLDDLIHEAYGIYERDRLSGGPIWADSNKFDVEAKVDSSFESNFATLSLEQRRRMLQTLLADRFGLVIRRVPAVRPIFELVPAKGDPKLKPSKAEELHHNEVTGMDGLVMHSDRGDLEVQGFSMASLAQLLSSYVGRPVIDRTGLTNRYTFALHWTPDDVPVIPSERAGNTQPGFFPADPPGFSISTALQSKLGLNLRSSTGSVETLVVEHASMPSGN
jgi:uncharacterized protein (TIGR03435 family)